MVAGSILGSDNILSWSHGIISMAIIYLALIQIGQLSITREKICT